MKTKSLATISIIASAITWGCAGLFTNYLLPRGVNSGQTASFRMIIAAICIAVIVFFKDRKAFRIKLSDLPILIAIGSISQFLTSFLYLNSVTASSMGTAAILMYTAPFIVVIAAAILYKEKLTIRKIVALIVAFIGCVLVSGSAVYSPKGVIFGLASGVTYASYSIFCKKALKNLDNITITLYGFIFAAITSLIFVDFTSCLPSLKDYKTLLLVIGVGVISSLIPYLLYTYGLKHIPAGNASIIAMLEPLVATVLGFICFKQVMTPAAIIGIILIISAVIIIEIKVKK